MTQQKILIFDASTLISFAMNGLLPEFKELKKIFNGKFIITNEVKAEIIDKPLHIQRFELQALQLKQLIDEGILELASVLGISDSDIAKEGNLFLNTANSVFIGKRKEIKLISLGEASCLGLSKLLNQQKVSNVIGVDERTTRMLCEKPDNLKNLLNKRLHTQIKVDESKLNMFNGFKFVRSAELVYVAYKKNLVKLKNGNVLNALLWAVKLKGCAISPEEINEIKGIK